MVIILSQIIYFNCVNIDVSESHFHDVIQLLGSDDLLILYHALGIDYRDVEKAERKTDTPDIDTRALHVLRLWRNRLGERATRSSILDALQKCRNVEAQEILDYTWNQRGIVI